VLQAGDTILVTDGVYQPVRRFCTGLLRRFGVETIFYPADAAAEEILALAPPQTRLILMESPASQTFEMVDVPAVARLARDRGILTMIDNTWAAGLVFRPLDHGVDLSAQALTKYVCGHSDVFLGSVCVNSPELEAALRQTMVDAGFAVTGEEAYQGLRGLRTLPTRFARHAASAMEVATWLQQQPEVARVLYPAMPQDRFHDLWRRDYAGACGLFSVELHPMPNAVVERLLDGLKLFGLGFSWGGFESLATLAVPTRTARRWTGGPIVRLSIGLESPGDLIADLDQALTRIRS
jgi:cysteine-S-conjugate beta-lyase